MTNQKRSPKISLRLYPKKDKDLLSVIAYLNQNNIEVTTFLREILKKFITGDMSPIGVPGFATFDESQPYVIIRLPITQKPDDKKLIKLMHQFPEYTHNTVYKNIIRSYLGPNIAWAFKTNFDDALAEQMTKEAQTYNRIYNIDTSNIKYKKPPQHPSESKTEIEDDDLEIRTAPFISGINISKESISEKNDDFAVSYTSAVSEKQQTKNTSELISNSESSSDQIRPDDNEFEENSFQEDDFEEFEEDDDSNSENENNDQDFSAILNTGLFGM